MGDRLIAAAPHTWIPCTVRLPAAAGRSGHGGATRRCRGAGV